MKLLHWLLGLWSRPARATRIYNRGLAHANARQPKAALADYSAVIDMPDAPPDVRAMALYNRSVVYAASRREAEAVADLKALLEMPGASGHVKQEAHRKLVRMQKTSDRTEQQRSKSES